MRVRTPQLTRERVAAASMAAGMPAAAVGVGMLAGPGAGLVALGAMLVALAVLLGWR